MKKDDIEYKINKNKLTDVWGIIDPNFYRMW